MSNGTISLNDYKNWIITNYRTGWQSYAYRLASNEGPSDVVERILSTMEQPGNSVHIQNVRNLEDNMTDITQLCN